MTTVAYEDVNAIPGLEFQPGPAAVVLKLKDSTEAIMEETTSESGSKINLRP